MTSHGRLIVCLSTVLYLGPLGAAPTFGGADVVIAELDGKAITAGELTDALSVFSPETRDEILQPDKRRQLVENFLSWKLLVAEARRRNIESSAEFQKRIDRAKNDILLELLQDRLRAEIHIDDKDIKSYYDARKKEFGVPEKRRAKHILVESEKEANEILQRVRAGAKFDDEARLHSVDRGTAAEGGDIGWHGRQDLVPEFSKAIFAMKPGEIQDRPLKTRFGWHVVRLEAVLPERLPALSEVKQEVQSRLLKDRAAALIPDLTRRLREHASLKIFDDRLTALGRARRAD